jgi:hypothetical protein
MYTDCSIQESLARDGDVSGNDDVKRADVIANKRAYKSRLRARLTIHPSTHPAVEIPAPTPI